MAKQLQVQPGCCCEGVSPPNECTQLLCSCCLEPLSLAKQIQVEIPDDLEPILTNPPLCENCGGFGGTYILNTRFINFGHQIHWCSFFSHCQFVAYIPILCGKAAVMVGIACPNNALPGSPNVISFVYAAIFRLGDCDLLSETIGWAKSFTPEQWITCEQVNGLELDFSEGTVPGNVFQTRLCKTTSKAVIRWEAETPDDNCCNNNRIDTISLTVTEEGHPSNAIDFITLQYMPFFYPLCSGLQSITGPNHKWVSFVHHMDPDEFVFPGVGYLSKRDVLFMSCEEDIIVLDLVRYGPCIDGLPEYTIHYQGSAELGQCSQKPFPSAAHCVPFHNKIMHHVGSIGNQSGEGTQVIFP